VGVLLWLRLWGRSAFDAFPPGALDDYLPHDAAAVVAINLKELRDKGLFDKPLGKELHEALTTDDVGLPFHLLGVDPAADVDAVRLAFSARDHGRPLVLLRGRFDRDRFRTEPGQLEEFRDGGFRLYRFKNAGRETTLAQAGDTLVAGLARSRVIAALRHASGKEAATLTDDRFKAILDKVDRKRAVWFAANLARLGRPPQLLFEAQLRPIFEVTQTLSGGVTWTENLRAVIDFTTRGDGEAVKLESHVLDVVRFARLAELLPVREEFAKVFLRLLANAEVRREGKEVTLRARIGLD
jgi:hypothetical protein